MPNVTSILIVDEDKSTADAYQLLLEKVGYNVMTAASPQAASQILIGIEIDLILLNYDLPENASLEWLRKIRADGRYKQMPVLLVSQARRQLELNDEWAWFAEKPRHAQHIVTALEKTINNLAKST